MGSLCPCCQSDHQSRGASAAGDPFLEGRLGSVAFASHPGFQEFKTLKKVENINDFYCIGDFLGKGAYGSVHKAVLLSTETECAVKMVKKSAVREPPRLQELMLQELEVMQTCRHPNILKLIDLREDDEYFYIVSELLEGGELVKRITQNQHLSERNVAYIVRQILLAVNYMHGMKIAHRDLKPENLLMESSDDDDLSVKVADFGFSCFVNEEGLEQRLGTPMFMAPEIVKKERYTEKVDIWSIGIITYILLSGRVPFAGRKKEDLYLQIRHQPIDFQNKHIAKITKSGRRFLMAALQKDPEQRASAKDLLDHPWLQLASKQIEKQSTDNDVLEVLSNIEKFARFTKFQKTVLSILQGLKADKMELRKLKWNFLAIDTNMDGRLSYKELKAAQARLKSFSISRKWDQVLRQCDQDGDGVIDFQEFQAAAIDHQKMVTKQNLEFAFSLFDANHDGEIDIDEFKTALPPARQKQEQGESAEDSKEDEKWQIILAEVDTNGDGGISFQEFQAAVVRFIGDQK